MISAQEKAQHVDIKMAQIKMGALNLKFALDC
jgi:hypothetical protein